jgi:hypothetical protein
MPLFPFLITTGLAVILACSAQAADNATRSTTELLATLTENTKVFTPPGASQVVWRERRGRMWTMVVNGVAGKDYANVGVPIFSPDGRHLAYTAQKTTGTGTQTVVIHNGKEGPAFAQVGVPQFTGDGRHVAYLAGEGDRLRPFLDDKPLESTGHPGTTGLLVNVDGSRWAYWREEGIVVDGQLRPKHKARSGSERVDAVPQFSPDGKRFAYRVVQGAKTILVVDDKESQPYDSATDPTFSADSKHVAYVAIRDRRAYAVVDGIEGPPLFKLLNNAIVFSPDSKSFAYFGLPQNIPYWWVPKGTDPRRVSGIFLLGGKLADVGEALKADPMDVLSVRVETVTGPVWSADGTHWAYARPEGTGTVIVANRNVSPTYEAVAGLAVNRTGEPVFASRQGTAWTARQGDQAVGKPMDELITTVLSPDGLQAAWVGRRGAKHFLLTRHGEGKAYDLVAAPVFNADGSAVHYIAREENRFLRVTQP